MAAIAVASRLGGWFEPADFLNQFALFWIGGGILAGSFAMLGRARRAGPGAALLIMAAVGVQILLPEPAPPRGQSGEDVAGLRIVQFNLWKDNPDPTAAVAWLKAQAADIIVLEEVIGREPSVPWLLRHDYPFQQSCVDRGPCSTILLARHAPIASGGYARSDPENRTGLSAAWMRLAGECGAFSVVGVHLSRPWPWPGGAEDRAELVANLAGESPSRLIVAGDFNLAATTIAIRRFDRQLGMRLVSGVLPTWPGRIGGIPMPGMLAIDQIHAGLSWQLAGLSRGPTLGSDHFPVVANLIDAGCKTDIG